MKIGEEKEAFGAYQDALTRYPNNMSSLHGMRKCYLAMGQKEHAEKIRKHIELISPRSE